MAPCVALLSTRSRRRWPASPSSGSTDSGVSARLFGTLLTWLNDHTSDVFFVCTANDVSKLPPEFSAGRAVRRRLLPRPARPAREGGDLADVPAAVRARRRPASARPTATGPAPRSQACCRLAALLDVPLLEAATNIVPVAVTAGESVERLRNWAGGRCLSADRPGIYARGSPDARRSPAAASARPVGQLITPSR